MQVRMRFSSNGLPTCQTPEMPASLGFGSTMSTISQGQGQMGRRKGERSPHPPSRITNFSCNPVEPTSLGETLRNSPRFVVADSIAWPSSRGRRLSRCGVSAAPPIVPRTCPGKTTAGRSNALPLPPPKRPCKREREGAGSGEESHVMFWGGEQCAVHVPPLSVCWTFNLFDTGCCESPHM